MYNLYGVDAHGQRDLLGIHLGRGAESSTQRGIILEDLKTRGVQDILFVCSEGLTGLKARIEASFPESLHQGCIIHSVRNSVRFVAEEHRQAVCADLRKIYTTSSQAEARLVLEPVGQNWDEIYPQIRRQ